MVSPSAWHIHTGKEGKMEENFVYNVYKFISCIVAAFIGYVAPMFPYLAICIIAIVLDAISAWDLSRRVALYYPKQKAKKFNSADASKIIGTMLRISSLIVLMYMIDTHILTFVEMYLANIMSAVFCMLQVWSILENISSCSDERWAKVLQKILVDKTKRHLDIDIDEDDFKGMKKNTKKKQEE